MASIKVYLVVIVFKCINFTSVHSEIDNVRVKKIIFRTTRLFWGRKSSFFSKNCKKLKGRGQKLVRVG